MAGLTGALVGPRLEEQSPVPPAPVLLLREVPLVLGGHLGPKGRAGVLRVLLSDPSQGVDTESNLREVLPLEQIWSEEHLLVRHFELLDTAGLDLVDQFAEDHSVLQHIGEVPSRKR